MTEDQNHMTVCGTTRFYTIVATLQFFVRKHALPTDNVMTDFKALMRSPKAPDILLSALYV